MMQRDAWIKSLKVGDKVAIDIARFGNAKYKIHAVKKITPTGRIVLDNDMQFNKDGVKKIDEYHSIWISPISDDIIKNIIIGDTKKLIKIVQSRICSIDTGKYSYGIDNLKKIQKNLKEILDMGDCK